MNELFAWCEGCNTLTLIEMMRVNLETQSKYCRKCVGDKRDNIYCTCPTECDCENPPPDDWDGKSGVFHISNWCPIHNLDPDPADNCPVHGQEY